MKLEDKRQWRWEAKNEVISSGRLKVGEKINVGYLSSTDKYNYLVGIIKEIRVHGKQIFVEMPDGKEICI